MSTTTVEVPAQEECRNHLEFKRLYEEEHPETKHGGDRRSEEFQVPESGTLVPRYTQVAAALGVVRQTVDAWEGKGSDAKDGNASPPDLRPTERVAVTDHFRAEIEKEHPPGRPAKGGKFPPLSEPAKARDILAAMIGWSGKTLERCAR